MSADMYVSVFASLLLLLGFSVAVGMLLVRRIEHRHLLISLHKAQAAVHSLRAQRLDDTAHRRIAMLEASLSLRHLQAHARKVGGSSDRTALLRASLHLVRAVQFMERSAQTQEGHPFERGEVVAATSLSVDPAPAYDNRKVQASRHIPARRVVHGDAAWLPSLPTS